MASLVHDDVIDDAPLEAESQQLMRNGAIELQLYTGDYIFAEP